MEITMFDKLKEINSRPEPYQFYTAEELWTDEHTSKKMLEYHLNDSVDLSSRNKDFIEHSVKWIISFLGVDEHTSIADFGCGPGLYTTLFAESGAKVTGIDFSGRSIQYAQNTADQKGLDITYIQHNYLDFEAKQHFDLITMIFCDFCALSPVQRKTLLEKFQKFLKPDGAVLLDVHSLNAFNEKKEIATYELNQLDHFWSSDNYYGFLNSFKYDREKVSLDKYTIIEESRSRIIYNWLQYFNQESLKKELEDCGFQIEEFFSDVTGSPFSAKSPEIAVVGRKYVNSTDR